MDPQQPQHPIVVGFCQSQKIDCQASVDFLAQQSDKVSFGGLRMLFVAELITKNNP